MSLEKSDSDPTFVYKGIERPAVDNVQYSPNSTEVDKDVALMSIAISLKRIAEMIEEHTKIGGAFNKSHGG